MGVRLLNWIIHMTITEAYQQMHSLLLRISVGLIIKTMLFVCSWTELLPLVL